MPKAHPITKERFFEPMITACPSFERKWSQFREEWQNDPILLEDGRDGTLPHYLALSELANHLIELLERGDTRTFPAVFDVVEDWVVNGEHYVSEAATVGLLEDLTSEGRYNTRQPTDFLPWLGPRSRENWFAVIEFWDRLEKGNFRPLSAN